MTTKRAAARIPKMEAVMVALPATLVADLIDYCAFAGEERDAVITDALTLHLDELHRDVGDGNSEDLLP